jgi:hypothetical protein
MKARFQTLVQSLERDIQFQEEMMRSRSWKLTGLPTTVMVLGLFACATSALASPVVNYSTSGTIDSTGVTGTPVINFRSVISGAFDSPSSFSLGDFQVASLPDATSTSYKNTPFHITYLVNSLDNGNTSAVPNGTPIQVSGLLNGTITGGNQSQVKATFDPITNSSFGVGGFNNTLSISDNPLTLVPSTTNNGQTSAQAFLTSTATSSSSDSSHTSGGSSNAAVPEPSTIALFLTTLAGLGVHRARRQRRV